MHIYNEITTKLFIKSYIPFIEDMFKKSNQEDISNKFFKYLLIIAGTIFLGFGVIGIFYQFFLQHLSYYLQLLVMLVVHKDFIIGL